MKKSLAIFLILSSVVFAQDENDFEQRLKVLEQENYENRFGPRYGEPVTVSSHPGALVARGEVLWWKYYTRFLPYASTSEIQVTQIPTTPPSQLNIPQKNRLHYLHYPQDVGFRLGFGHILDFGKWDTEVLWTQLHSYSTDSRFSANPLFPISFLQDFLLSIPIFNTPPGQTQSASAQGKLKMDLLDFEVGRTFWPIPHVSLKPILGIRGAWIRHNIDMSYRISGFGAGGSNLPLQVQDQVHFKHQIMGWGLRMGTDFRLLFLKGFEIYSNFFASLLRVGQFESVRERAVVNTTIVGPPASITQITAEVHRAQKFKRIATTLQMGLGAKWGMYFFKEALYFSLQGGYEANTWLDYNLLTNFFGVSDNPFQSAKPVAANLIDTNLDVGGWVFSGKFLF